MSNLSFPDYAPIHPATKTVKPRQRTAKLPSWGIEQRATQGRNQTAPEWSLKWILKPSEANTLDFFLAQQAKTGAWFLWTPPGVPQARFRCDNWTKQLTAPAVWEFQATFRQVFSFTLPRLGASTGYFTLSGTDTGFFRGYISRQDTGVFALTGNAATLTKTLPIFPDTGAFVLSGSAISTARTWQLSAETGAFVLTMQPATLAYLSLGGDYYEDWVIQTYGFEADIYPSWWAS